MKVRRSAPARFAELGPLPLRVRTSSGEVVGSGVTGAPIEVPDGNYLLTMLLPDGQEIGLEEEGEAAGAMMADADPAAETTGAALLPAAVADIPGFPAWTWRGNWLQSWAKSARSPSGDLSDMLPLSFQEPSFIRAVPEHDQFVMLRLEDRLRCTVVPLDECSSCGSTENEIGIAATLATKADGPAAVFRSTVSEEANTLLGFVELGVLTNMVSVTEDEVRRGEQAMGGRGSSALRVITGAYVLLRSNTLEGLDDWLRQLQPLGSRLPDLLPLRAELAARTGRHEEAVPLVDAWIQDGRCPWFRSGLSYMHERIKLYVDVTDNRGATFNLGVREYERFQEASRRLERLLPAMLTSRYIATFDLPLPNEAG